MYINSFFLLNIRTYREIKPYTLPERATDQLTSELFNGGTLLIHPPSLYQLVNISSTVSRQSFRLTAQWPRIYFVSIQVLLFTMVTPSAKPSFIAWTLSICILFLANIGVFAQEAAPSNSTSDLPPDGTTRFLLTPAPRSDFMSAPMLHIVPLTGDVATMGTQEFLVCGELPDS